MKIQIAGIVPESIVDGPGFRYTVFVQGCPHNCPGCHNPDSHDMCGGTSMETGEIISQIEENELIDGVTLSGGEPFAQAEACARIAEAACARGLTVWVYSGYTFEQLLKGAQKREDWASLLAAADVLIDGPYQQENRSLALRFRGSKNQRLIDLPASLASASVVEYAL